jgi:hypothetical protein
MVAGETLDGLVASLGLRPGLIKIDAEGAESRVLAGCERTMQINRPVILCEAWPDSLQMASGGGLVGELLRTRGYEWEGCGSGEILAFPK